VPTRFGARTQKRRHNSGLLIGGSTVGVRVTRGARQAFKSLTWTQINAQRATRFRSSSMK
jgi:hypothetical protein